MDEQEIIKKTLQYLDGWVLDNAENESLTDMDYNKKIKSEEIIEFYKTAQDYAASYTHKEDLEELLISNTAISLWCAGLLWNKYNIRVNNQEDETNTLGYGDKLIIQAKEMLKPYKEYTFNVW